MTTEATPSWVRDAVFYQIFPDRFASSSRVHKPGPLEAWDAPPTVHGFKGGDLRGIAEHIDYLVDLGINAIYLNPIFSSASNHRYHTFDYLAVDPLLGGDDALRELLDTAHARDIRVVLDGVFNHASRGFWPFHHVLEAGAGSPYRDWFYVNDQWLAEGRQLKAYPNDEMQGSLDPDWVEKHAAGEQSLHDLGYRAWWDLPALPKLNVGNPEMREYLMRVAEHWIRFGADGWRLDVAEEITDRSFWAEFRRRVRAVNPEAYIVAEIWHIKPDWLGPHAFDAMMDYPLAWAILGFVAGRQLDRTVVSEHGIIRKILQPIDAATFVDQLEGALSAYPAEHVAAQMNLLGSHDTPRLLSTCGRDEDSVRLALLLLMSLPGAPTVYYGDEVGMQGRVDPDCRRAFNWDPESWNRPLRDWIRGAIAVRHAEPALRADGYRRLAASGMACAYLRSDAGGTAALVAINAGEQPASLELPAMPGPASELILATAESSPELPGGDGSHRLALPPRWGGIWRTGS
jgi:cyclomaltodextrinase